MRRTARGSVVLGRSLMSVGVLVAVVGGFAHAASAWHPEVSGETTCANGDHVVTWTIGNSVRNAPMTIASATAVVGSTTYPVTGYDATVPDHGSTSATTIVPGGVTGTIVLTVDATWPAGQHASASASVVLEENCTSTTTTSTTDGGSTSTTSTSTTSTTEVSTTSTIISGSTTFFSQGSTSTTEPSSVSIAAVTSTTVAPVTLPVTGNDGWAPLLGLSTLVVGGGLSLVSRRRGAAKA